jgi:hypothetical protein
MNPNVQRELIQTKKNCMIDRKKINMSLNEADVPNVPIVPPYMYDPANECTGHTYFTFHRKPILKCVIIDEVNEKRAYYFFQNDLQRRYRNYFGIASDSDRTSDSTSYSFLHRFYKRLNDTKHADRLEKEVKIMADRQVAQSGISNGKSTTPMHQVYDTPGLSDEIRSFLPGQPRRGGTRRKRGRKGLKKRKTRRLRQKKRSYKNKK